MTIAPDTAREDAIRARAAELLTPQEFSRLTREHPKSVYRRIAEGRQPGVIRIGREIRIDIAAISIPDRSSSAHA